MKGRPAHIRRRGRDSPVLSGAEGTLGTGFAGATRSAGAAQLISRDVAEGEGFEPSAPVLPVQLLSRQLR